MEEHCVLCRREIDPAQEKKAISIRDKQYPVCAPCKQWYQCSSPEEQERLRKQALAYIGQATAVPAEVLCPACGTAMERKVPWLSLGKGPSPYLVELYACPRCGKVELYKPGYPKGN